MTFYTTSSCLRSRHRPLLRWQIQLPLSSLPPCRTTSPVYVRSWRILVLSSPLLWSSFFFSFSNPSDKTLVLLFRFVKQHLVRSRKLPLTAFIRLEGAYNYSLSKVIVALLSSRQSRWKRVGIWFETEAGKDVIPIPKMQLFVEAITLLEELQISFSTEYIITSSTGRSLRNALPSLTHLDLHTVCECREAMRWLDLAPNLKELNIKHGPNYTSDYIRHPSYPLLFEPEVVIPKIHMTHLHIINQTERFSPSGDVMLKRMSCPALTELHLDAGIFASTLSTMYSTLYMASSDEADPMLWNSPILAFPAG